MNGILEQIRRKIVHALSLKPGKYGIQMPKSAYPYIAGYDHEEILPQANEELAKIAANHRMLAYLSIAIESNHSILISGDDSRLNKGLLERIAGFIPISASAMMIEKDMQMMGYGNPLFNVHALYGKSYPYSSKKQLITEGLKSGPEWMIVDELHSNEADALFSTTGSGTSFMSTIKCSSMGCELINRIAAKPTSIAPERLSSLDVSVAIDSSRNTHIFEYMWLSRGEIEEGIELSGKDMLAAKDISQLKTEDLEGSKIMQRYSDMTGFTMQMSISELASRAASPKI